MAEPEPGSRAATLVAPMIVGRDRELEEIAKVLELRRSDARVLLVSARGGPAP